MASYKDLILYVFLCFQTVLYQSVKTCTTVGGGMGVCVSLGTCAPYLTLLQQEQDKTDIAVLRQLRDANCGYRGKDPYVCCPVSDLPTIPPIVEPDKSSPTSDFISAFPVPPVCGFSNVSSSRVVGRVDAELGAFPWMSLLGYRGHKDGNTRWLCGGSLISQHHVLTAAHCITFDHNILYKVRLGDLDITRDDDGATPIDILIKNTIKHEKYHLQSFTNDIGILVLERDVEFTDLIRPICMPTRADLRANTFVDYTPLIAGWGHPGLSDAPASHLQVEQLPVQDNSYCANVYSRSKAVIDKRVMCVGLKKGGKVQSDAPASHLQVEQLPVQDNSYCANVYSRSKAVIDKRVMCVGLKKGGKGLGQLDGGGPLMQPDYNPVESATYFYQIGVVSYGPRHCGEICNPDMLMRVTSYVPWLHKNVLGYDEDVQFNVKI